MAVKKGSRSRARKPAARKGPTPAQLKTLHRKLAKLYIQKVDLDLQIFAIQMRLATSRDKSSAYGCVPLA